MKYGLYSMCLQNDGWHWLLIATCGIVVACSQDGFATEELALRDLYRFL